MSTHKIASSLAQLGRNGDSMLMHVQPHEVAGLQALAQANGTSLTINPDTGMPEAFSLGNFFSALLPTAAGFLMGGPGGAAMGLESGTLSATAAPIIAGAATGAIMANAQGGDPLMGGLMGGMGGYGGGALAGDVVKFGAPTATTAATTNSTANALGVGAEEAANISNFGAMTADQADTLANVNKFGAMTTPTTTTTPSAFQQGLSNIADKPMDFLKQPGVAMRAGMPLAMAGLSGLEPSDLGYNTKLGTNEDKYDPYATLNLSGDTGLRFPRMAAGGPVAFAAGGAMTGGGSGAMEGAPAGTFGDIPEPAIAVRPVGHIIGQSMSGPIYDRSPMMGWNAASSTNKPAESVNPFSLDNALNVFTGKTESNATPESRELRIKFADGGSITTGGIRDLYGSSDNTPNPMLSRDGYGIGRLDTLAGDQSSDRAKALGYARGGYLDGPGDGMSDSIPATIEGRQPARLADGEFVVPADVVSHLGNGSTKAGSQRLYGMLDKVRKARTGTKKQGKQINPNKYLPA